MKKELPNTKKTSQKTNRKLSQKSNRVNIRKREARPADQAGRYQRRRRGRRNRRQTLTAVLTVIAVFLICLLAALTIRAFRSRGRKTSGSGTYRVANAEPVLIQDLQDEKCKREGNAQKYIAIHYLGVPADGHSIESTGVGTHFYIYSDGTIYQSASLHMIPYHVGTAGYYKKLHEDADNHNTIGIEMCPLCDGDPSDDEDPQWYFTTETQEACVLLVRNLMKELKIPEENVLRHGDIVNKYCPAPYLNNNNYKTSWTWDEFKENVRELANDQVPDLDFSK